MKISWAVIARFAVIGALWVYFCFWLVGRYLATGTPLTLLSLLPIPISGAIIFIPMYKKYVKGQPTRGLGKDHDPRR